MMAKPLGVHEDIETTPRRTLFRLMGVPFNITPQGWVGTLQPFLGGAVLGVVLSIGDSSGVMALNGLWVGVLVVASLYMHSIGHIVGGKLVGAPMDELLLTMTRQVNVYRGAQDYPSKVHLARAMGGPIGNILLGLVLLAGWLLLGGLPLVVMGVGNIAGGLGAALAPIPTVDGEILYRELGKLAEGRSGKAVKR